ncbi:MAG TPA: endonuclease VII domain-containing protein [Candidatus Saccharimonadales bacterium]|nr:endonuclease VII domain-containing protein [Candidatus Saccharimonadales bacterium]
MNKSQKHRLKDLEAYRERKREYAKTESQKEKRRLYMRKWRAKNQEKSNAARREYHHRNKTAVNARQKIQHIKYKYGLTLEQFEAMTIAQNGQCRLCGRIPKAGKIRGLHVDHSHTTGQIRGLLCVSCNTILGRIEAVGLDKFATYLKLIKE